MSRLDSLKAARSLGDLAVLLGFKPKAVSYILYKQPVATKYRSFQIPKRSGGRRTINAPAKALRLLQRRLSALLQDCVDEINAAKQRKDRAAHGFKRKRSIITNARQHRHRRWVLNIDLENFFESINFGRVRGFFLKSREFLLHESVATVIAQIACYQNALPQGSPCSPVISNIVAQMLDVHLIALASKFGCTYSRYADDITFSTNKREFPLAIAAQADRNGASHTWQAGEDLKNIVGRAGFRINAKKTRLMYRSSRQNVTGLVVNKKINVPWDYYHSVRAMVHKLVRTGAFELYGAVQKDGDVLVEMRPGTLDELHGMLGFIDSVEHYNRTQTSERLASGKSSREAVYRRFLYYREFYAAAAPVILCEGPTDSIYLAHAIRRLAAGFPALVRRQPTGEMRLKVRLYKYRRRGKGDPRPSSTARLLGINDGGSAWLSKFIAAYKKETAGFGAPGLEQPVIVVYDNDAGAKSVVGAIEKATGTRPTGTEPFVHVYRNLYAVATPVEAGTKSSSTIEDLFDADTRATVLGGKTFNPGHGFDDTKHYSKTVFAHKVVRPKASTISFEGFRSLLANIVAAIDAHKDRDDSLGRSGLAIVQGSPDVPSF